MQDLKEEYHEGTIPQDQAVPATKRDLDLDLDLERNPSFEINSDQKVLTKREIQGWLAYAVAAEPYSVVCISALAPIVLEALSSGYGRQHDNRDLPCNT
ncbi:hypothetical protein BGZ54_007687, partial [Gamsiella multidivaricata]